ncbi:MAG: class I SAM-dependent methyltransferase [Candidatus Delongbacteria bacterium]|nr:class I SAM-dependent methyltransferase [Candidatus Delongbacteria bacterium]
MSGENFDNYLVDIYNRSKEDIDKKDDYLEYLIQKVWKIDKPVSIVDFGCGYGRMGIELLKLLPAGSSYTGIDISEKLINTAKKIFSDLSLQGDFYVGDAREVPFKDNLFDIALSYTVLMHIADPMKALKEMKRVVKDNGKVITCDATRMAYSTLIYSEEFEKYNYSLDMLQKYYKSQRDELNLDYNIGVKVPVLMSKIGLTNIGAKFHNNIDCLLQSNSKTENEKIYKGILSQGYGEIISDEEAEKHKNIYMKRGATVVEAEDRVNKERELAKDFVENGINFNVVYPNALTWSYGTVKK